MVKTNPNKKKLREHVRVYYKGPLRKPTRVANEQDMQIISRALIECVPHRFKSAFKSQWEGKSTSFKLVIGLSAALRHLKRRRTVALVIDDTADENLFKLLVEFSCKLSIPTMLASKLINVAPQLKLKTLLVFSLVRVESDGEPTYSHKASDPLPKPVESTLELQSFHGLVSLLQGDTSSGSVSSTSNDKYSFKLPHLEHVKSTGKSKAKKEARANQVAENKKRALKS